MKRYRVIVDGLCLEVYRDESIEAPELAVYLFGFPGSAGKTEPVERMVAAGYTVIQPHYRGCYDSSGEFTPASSIELLSELQDIISKGKLIEVKKQSEILIPKNISLVLGHSYGCFAVLKGCSVLRKLKKIVLMGPVLCFEQGPKGIGYDEDGDYHYKYVTRSRPLTYRLGAWDNWENAYAGKLDSLSFEAPKSLKEVHLVIGENDNYFNMELLRKNSENIVRNTLKEGSYSINLDVVDGVGHGPKGLFTKKILSFF